MEKESCPLRVDDSGVETVTLPLSLLRLRPAAMKMLPPTDEPDEEPADIVTSPPSPSTLDPAAMDTPPPTDADASEPVASPAMRLALPPIAPMPAETSTSPDLPLFDSPDSIETAPESPNALPPDMNTADPDESADAADCNKREPDTDD